MDYAGTGARLQQGDIGRAAKAVGLPTAALLSWLEVEVGAQLRGFDNKNRLIILPEPHRFYANLGAGAKRARAVKEGLAYPNWGEKPYPPSYDARYAQLKRMEAIDPEAAWDSTSQGLPQILGQNAEAAGFCNAVHMYETFKRGELEQLNGMVALMVEWGIVASLKGKDLTNPENWRPAASKWNGSGYAKNGYHIKLAEGVVKHGKGDNDNLVVPPEPTNVILTNPVQKPFIVLRFGVKGERVMNLQSDLLARGYDPGPIDGRFENKTKNALINFQRVAGLSPVDGVYGPMTHRKLQETPILPTAPKPPEQTWPQQQPRGWLAVLIDTLLNAILAAFRRK